MKKILSKVLAVGVSAVLVAGALTACGGSSSSSASASASGSASSAAKTLTFGIQAYSAGGVNTVQETNTAWNAMRYGITESLYKFTDTMDVEGWLASDYTVSDDHKTWTFTIRKDAKFSDGCQVTASKVAECYNWLKTEGPKGSANPQNFLEYSATITADDAANTVTIVTETAYPDLRKNLAHPIMAIVDVADTKDFSNGIIGSGPYAVGTFKTDVGYTMVANANYYEEVPYETVEILFLGDATAKSNALKGGQVDLVENVANAAEQKSLKEDSKYTLNVANGVRTGLSFINQKEGAFLANDTLRHAVLKAIDGATIASVTVGGLYTYGYSVLPSNLDYNYASLTNPDAFDAEAAKKMLDEAGIVDTNGDGIRELDGKEIILNWDTYENRCLADIAQAGQQLLAEIGIGVDLNVSDSDSLWNEMVNGEFDLSSSNWTTVATGDPTDYLANWCSDNKADYCGYSNAEYNECYKQLKTETDSAKRKELITKMQQILLDDGAVVVHGYWNSSMAFNSSAVAEAPIHTADYYWLTTEIKPAK